MKIKILSIIILLCLLIPLASLFVFADSSVSGDSFFEFNYEIKTTDSGEQYYVGFEKFIDPELYSAKACSPGYNDINVLGIDENVYIRSDGFYISLYFYIYNPQKRSINNNGGSPDAGLCGAITFIADSGETFDYDLSCFSDYDYNGMFLVFEVSLDSFSGGYCDYLDLKKRVYNISEMEIWCLDEPFTINYSVYRRFVFEGFDENKKMKAFSNYLDFSNPLTDLVMLNPDKYSSVDDVKAEYTNMPSESYVPIFMYEENYGTDYFEVYLYVYDSMNKFSYYLQDVYIWNGEMFKPYCFKRLSKEGNFVKLKMQDPEYLSEYLSRDDVRDYHISGIFARFLGFIETKSHFEFSSYDLSQFDYKKMKHSFRIKLPSSLESGTYRIENLDGLKEISEKVYSGFITDVRFVEDGILEFDYDFLSDFVGPVLSTIDISVYFEFVEPDHDFNFVCLKNDEIIYTNQDPLEFLSVVEARDSATSLFSNDEKSISPLYLRSNQEVTIEIEANASMYRLDSSSSGLDFYQTLTSLYFSMPSSYFEVDDLNFLNNRYVSSVELSYLDAYLSPIIVTSNPVVREAFWISPYYRQSVNDDYFIATNLKLEETTDTVVPSSYYSADVLIGEDDTSGRQYFDVKYKQFDSLNYILLRTDNFDSMNPLNLKKENLVSPDYPNLSFESPLETKHYVLSFEDSKTLSSFRDMTFSEMIDNLGFWHALWFNLTGTTQKIQDSVANINCIDTLYPADLALALALEDEALSSKYYVQLSEISGLRSAMQKSLDNNECFVFLRFDVFDYYASSDLTVNWGFYHELLGKMDFNDTCINTFLCQTKYYEDIDILSIGLSNSFDTKIYEVKMEPIDYVSPPTVPDPIDPDQILDPLNPDFYDAISESFAWTSIIISIVIIIVLIIIFHEPVFAFINFLVKGIKKFFKWFFGLFKRKNKKI